MHPESAPLASIRRINRILLGNVWVLGLGLALAAGPASAQLLEAKHKPVVAKHKPGHGEVERASKAPFGDIPKGPMQAIISISQQRLHLYRDGQHITDVPVATGLPGHLTPLGVFSVIERDRYHHSNLYSNAPMPFMERITWSGVALHEGPGVGHQASHGCIRMPHDFAARLWQLPTMGMRVIIAGPELQPLDFSDPHLFVHKDKPVPTAALPKPVETAQTGTAIKTDAGDVVFPAPAAIPPGLAGKTPANGAQANPLAAALPPDLAQPGGAPPAQNAAPAPLNAPAHETAKANEVTKPGDPGPADAAKIEVAPAERAANAQATEQVTEQVTAQVPASSAAAETTAAAATGTGAPSSQAPNGTATGATTSDSVTAAKAAEPVHAETANNVAAPVPAAEPNKTVEPAPEPDKTAEPAPAAEPDKTAEPAPAEPEKTVTTNAATGAAPAEAMKTAEPTPAPPAGASAKPAEQAKSPEPVRAGTSDIAKAALPNMTAPIALDEVPLPLVKPARIARADGGPIAIFVSRQEGKIFVRQDFLPVLVAPVKIQHPEEPLGTHVFTALNYLPDHSTLRWNVVSLPGEAARKVERFKYVRTATGERRRERVEERIEPALPTESPERALARIDIPQDVIDQISQLIVPGSSLVVSDHGLGPETDASGTDFIVITR